MAGYFFPGFLRNFENMNFGKVSINLMVIKTNKIRSILNFIPQLECSSNTISTAMVLTIMQALG